MDRFRFWKRGYWREQLAGLPYHIRFLYWPSPVHLSYREASFSLAPSTSLTWSLSVYWPPVIGCGKLTSFSRLILTASRIWTKVARSVSRGLLSTRCNQFALVDLPNSMQHELPIYHLPQEWLWCETWCSDELKEKAKTIDLVKFLNRSLTPTKLNTVCVVQQSSH
jgi:UDP-glucose:glycoprotein glucosyltransferase